MTYAGLDVLLAETSICVVGLTAVCKLDAVFSMAKRTPAFMANAWARPRFQPPLLRHSQKPRSVARLSFVQPSPRS
jgi:hypothetical protein